MNLAIDFHLYKSSGNFAAKEYAVFDLNPFDRKISLLEHNVVLPEAQESDEYDEDKLFNIPWLAGDINSEQMIENINMYLKISTCVLVRDEIAKTFVLSLFKIDPSFTRVTSVSNLGYVEIFPKGNACNHHSTEESNCAIISNMIVVVDFIAYELPNETFALKEFGLWPIAPDSNKKYITSHYSFRPPYEWSKLPPEYQLTYEAQSKHHGIPWEKGSTPFNAMIPVIIDDLKHVTGIYVTSSKTKVILTELIGDYKPISALENLGWFDNNEVVKNICNLHKGIDTHCAYDNARRMAVWIIYNEMIVDAAGFEPSVSIMKHVDLNNNIR